MGLSVRSGVPGGAKPRAKPQAKGNLLVARESKGLSGSSRILDGPALFCRCLLRASGSQPPGESRQASPQMRYASGVAANRHVVISRRYHEPLRLPNFQRLGMDCHRRKLINAGKCTGRSWYQTLWSTCPYQGRRVVPGDSGEANMFGAMSYQTGSRDMCVSGSISSVDCTITTVLRGT